MAKVKIALRVRPLSEREQIEDKISQAVVEVENEQSVAITNLKVPISNAGDSRARVKRFNFDFCFDSTSISKDNHTDQEQVYEKLGSIILESLGRGQDACVLAYGQSSSGKTYTMQGTNHQPGLAPRLCRALMTQSEQEEMEATVSFYEIYNERVRDLLTPDDIETIDGIRNLSPTANHFKKDLRVREHPKKGPYVEELSGVVVRSAEELYNVWSSGVRRRRTAATATNVRSSRSHALLSVRRSLPHPPVTLTLLDLAGSERPSRVNQSIPRQKEGANINRSLVALANVISALVSAGPRGGRYVPYRDSVLTWLLKDTLSGRATTVMIATVSPAASCYSETVNTMRWASRAARIPVSNARLLSSEGPHERTLRQLRAEIKNLRALLASAILQNESKIQADKTSEAMSSTKNEEIESNNKKSKIEESQDVKEITEQPAKEEKDSAPDNKSNEEVESVDSLASSRISIASVDTLSGNNSNPSTQGSNFNSSHAEDSLFGPRLHRTGSVHDVKPLVPLRSKKRQYSSHEVLPSMDKINSNRASKSNSNLKSNKSTLKSNTNENPITENSEDSSDLQKDKNIAYQPFNKRAEIVASVTDRLYSKLRSKEEVKMIKADVVPDRKNSKSLTELQICNNARKKLFDISHKALRVSRRFRIGVPVETQTDKPSALRVREVGTDVPDDIEPYELNNEGKMYRNMAISTDSHTLLCKEASVGTPCGSIYSDDKCVETDKINDSSLVITRTCGNMTENVCFYSTTATQTDEPTQPKRKHSSFTKYLKVTHEPPAISTMNDRLSSSVLNISISHDCPFENEIDGISDDSLETDYSHANKKQVQQQVPTAPPDLLNNHNSNENIADLNLPKSCEIPTTAIEPSISSCIGVTKPLRKKSSKSFFVGKRDVLNLDNDNESSKTESKSVPNQTYDSMTSEGARIINQDGVTSNILPSTTEKSNIDSIKSNMINGTEEQTERTYESKSTQANPSNEYVSSYADFLDDLYVPLPRVFFNSDCVTERWPTMKNLIMGRNDNIFPYNVKVSPIRNTGSRKRHQKTVTWKSEAKDKNQPSKSSNEFTAQNIHNVKNMNHKKDTNNSYQSQNSESETVDSDDIITESNNAAIKSPEKKYFKGIYCWGDKSPIATRRRKLPQRSFNKYNQKHNSTKCNQYVEATSNFINEATNLVSALSKVSNKLCESTPSIYDIKSSQSNSSPICNKALHFQDEKHIPNSNKAIKNISNENTYYQNSIDLSESENEILCSRIINDSLVNNDEHLAEPLFNDDLKMNGSNLSLNDDNISSGDELCDLENNLLDSLNNLEACTKRTSEYFSSVGDKYSQKFNRKLPDSVSIHDSIPYQQSRRSPSKYLQQLLELRKELVESTKRDEIICKQFQKR